MPKIFETLDKMEPAYDVLYKVVLFVCKILLIADILIAIYAVLARYIPVIPGASWTEEIILCLMSYMVVLSAALAIRKGTHIRMTSFDRYLPHKLLCVLDLFSDICVMILAFVMIVVGWNYASTIGSVGSFVSIPSLSRFWKYFPIPVAGVAMVVFQIEAMYEHIKAFWVKEDKE